MGDAMRIALAAATMLLLAGCGPRYVVTHMKTDGLSVFILTDSQSGNTWLMNPNSPRPQWACLDRN